MKTKIRMKMKKLIYKSGAFLLFSIFLITCTLSAQQATKEFHKEYTTGPNTTLELNNRYGDIVVETWDQNQVIIDVKVIVELPNKERAEKLLSYIDVQFSEGENLISAKTVLDEKFNFTGWGGESRKFSINYNVKMPVGVNLTLANRYGNTDLDDLHGLVKLDIKYGNLNASKLTRGNEKPLNVLNLAYGKATIDEAGWLDLTVRYSGNTEIIKCQALLLDSKYSKLRIGETSSIVGETKYDNLNIDKINNLVLDAGYADINVGTLTKKLKFEGGYGSFTVSQIPAGFESLEVDSRYIGVRLGIENNASYELNAKLSYGELKFDEGNFKNQKRIVENNSSETSGIVGTESSPASRVNVNTSYGSVKLY